VDGVRVKTGTRRSVRHPRPDPKGAGTGILPSAPTHGSAGIAAQLRRAISDNVYAYGDKLPPEREIARSLGASRTTVRKALRQLEERSFVRRKIGSGTFVVYGRNSHDEREIADVTSPLELIDVRLAVEPHIIQLAVLHGTMRDMEAIAEALVPLELAGADREHFTEWDQRFHMALASATHNPLMLWIYRQINEVRGHTQWSKAKDKVLTPARIAEYNAQHRALFEAVQARDAETAHALMARHLEDARRDLVRAPSGP
jgi:GntR family transcriptional regulator, uxu operon transcriptional repressor